MANAAWIALGGAIGALARFGVTSVALRWGGATFPWGTLAVNLLGSFLAGFLWAILADTVGRQRINAVFMIGVLGAFTTFSTYSLESIRLFHEGETTLALINVLANNVGALLAVVAGFSVARLLTGFSPKP